MTVDTDMIVEQSDFLRFSEEPVLSVLMIAYNHENYIGQAIEGVVSQKVSFSIELVIGEDCSTDATRAIILEYKEKYPEIIKVIYSASNVGVNRNFSRTLSSCKGEFIAICEGDDYWDDDAKLEKQVAVLLNMPECIVTYHDAIHLSTVFDDKPKFRLNADGRNGYSSNQLTRYAYMPTLTMCFRNVIKSFPDEFYKVKNADTFLISLLGQYGNAIYVAGIKPAMYREHEGGIWSGLSDEDKKISSITTYYWLSSYYNRLGNHSLSNFYANSAMNHMLSVVKVSKPLFLKWFVIKYFNRTHDVYYAFKNKLKLVFAGVFNKRKRI